MAKLSLSYVTDDEKALVKALDEAHQNMWTIQIAGVICKISDKQITSDHSFAGNSRVDYSIASSGEKDVPEESVEGLSCRINVLEKLLAEVNNRLEVVVGNYITKDDFKFLKNVIASEGQAMLGKPSVMSRLDSIEEAISAMPEEAGFYEIKEDCYSSLSIKLGNKNPLVFLGTLSAGLNGKIWSYVMNYNTGFDNVDVTFHDFAVSLVRKYEEEEKDHMKEVHVVLTYSDSNKCLSVDNIYSKDNHAIESRDYNRIVEEVNQFFDETGRAMSIPTKRLQYRKCL